MPISIPPSAPDLPSTGIASGSASSSVTAGDASNPPGSKKPVDGSTSDFSQALASANGSSGQTAGARRQHSKGQGSSSPSTAGKTAPTTTAAATTGTVSVDDAQATVLAANSVPPAPSAVPTLPMWLGSVPNAQGLTSDASLTAAGDETGGEGEASTLLMTGTTLQMGGLALAGKGRIKGQSGTSDDATSGSVPAKPASVDTEAKDGLDADLVEAQQATDGESEKKVGSGSTPTVSSGVSYTEEKIAAIAARSQFSGGNPKSFGDKNSQDSNQKVVTTASAALGTSVAKSDPVMPSDLRQHTALDATSSSDASSLVRSVSATASTTGPAHVSQPSVSEQFAIPSTAEGAVQTVMHVVDLQASTGQSTAASVNLHFKIGDSNLAVRVEMQAGVVHTQFSTDSNDLRNAIKTEWQSSVSDTVSTKAVHFSDPVFSSSGDGSTGGGNAGNDRGNPQNRYASPDDLASISAGSFSSGSSETEAMTAASSPAASPLSNRLLTFA